MEELKEWGIEPYEETYQDPVQQLNRVVSTPMSTGSYGLSQYTSNVKPILPPHSDNKVAAGAHNLAYSAYVNRRPGAAAQQQPQPQPQPALVLSVNTNLVPDVKAPPVASPMKNPYSVFASNARPVHHQTQRLLTPAAESKSSSASTSHETDDEYYEPIIARLEDIFQQLRFYDEVCRERLVCSMYKSPALYSPHSNLVSNELSR